jgi:hypothetical protein
MIRRGRWSTASSALKKLQFTQQFTSERMMILNQVWEKEVGRFARLWVLEGVRRGILYVDVKSPAAAQELQMRGGVIVKSLNKYFKRSWIKGIRQTRKTRDGV